MSSGGDWYQQNFPFRGVYLVFFSVLIWLAMGLVFLRLAYLAVTKAIAANQKTEQERIARAWASSGLFLMMAVTSYVIFLFAVWIHWTFSIPDENSSAGLMSSIVVIGALMTLVFVPLGFAILRDDVMSPGCCQRGNPDSYWKSICGEASSPFWTVMPLVGFAFLFRYVLLEEVPECPFNVLIAGMIGCNGLLPLIAIGRSVPGIWVRYWSVRNEEARGVLSSTVGAGKEAHCSICGECIGGSIVSCAKCKAPYHEECFRYTGNCAVFGCDSRDSQSVSPIATARDTPEASGPAVSDVQKSV